MEENFPINLEEKEREKSANSPRGQKYQENFGYAPDSPFMIIYSIIQNVNSFHMWHPFFYTFQSLLPFIQYTISFCYTGLEKQYDKTQFGKFIRMLYHIVLFDSPHNIDNIPWSSFGICIGFYIFFILIFLLSYFLFKSYGRIPKLLSYICVLTFQILIYNFFIPLFFSAGLIIPKMINANIAMIVSFLLVISFIVLGSYSIYFFGSLINFFTTPSRNIFDSYNGKFYIIYIFVYSINIFFQGFKDHIANWFYIVFLFAQMGISGYLFYLLLYMPFVRLSGNILTGGFISANILFSIIKIVCNCGIHINPIILFFVSLVIFLLTLTALQIIFYRWQNKIFVELEDAAMSSEATRKNYISTLGILSNRQANLYVHFGFATLSHSILDGTFLVTITKEINDLELTLECASILSFFSSNRNTYEELLQRIITKYTPGFVDKLRIVYLHHQRRCSNEEISEDYSRCLQNMKVMTNQIIDRIRDFWKSIGEFSQFYHEQLDYFNSQSINPEIDKQLELQSSSHEFIPQNINDNEIKPTETIQIDIKDSNLSKKLYKISQLTKTIIDAKVRWGDVLELYPNDTDLLSLYATFLSEALGKIEEGTKIALKADELKEAKILQRRTPLFTAFIKVVPQALKNGIVDRYGNVRNGLDRVPSGQQINKNNGDFFDSNDQDKLDSAIFQAYDYPKLRTDLEKATSNYRPSFSIIMMTLLVLGNILIIFFALLIPIDLFISPLKFTISYNTKIRTIFNMKTAIAFGVDAQLLKFEYDNGELFSWADYLNEVPENEYDDIPLTFGSYKDDIAKWGTKALNDYMEISKLSLYSMLDTNDSIRAFCSGGSLTNTVERPPLMSILDVIWHLQLLSDTNIDNSTSEDFICEIANVQRILGGSIAKNVFSNLGEIDEHIKTKLQDIIGFTSTIETLFCFITVPLIVIPEIYTYLSWRHLFEAVETVDPEGAESATKPLKKTAINPPTYNQGTDQTQLSLNQLTNQLSNQISNQMSSLSVNKSGNSIYQDEEINNINDDSRLNEEDFSKEMPSEIILFIFFLVSIIIIFCLIGYSSTFIRKGLNSLLLYIKLNSHGYDRTSLTAEMLGAILHKFIYSVSLPDPYINSISDSLITNNTFFLRGENKLKGMLDLSTSISNLHLNNWCNNNQSSTKSHELFHCLALERALSTLVVYGQQSLNNGLKSRAFIDFLHFLTNEVYDLLKQSDSLSLKLFDDKITHINQNFIILYILRFIFLAVVLISEINFHLLNKENLETILALIRHLPPSTVVNTPSLLNKLLSKYSDDQHSITDIHEFIYSQINTPVVLVEKEFVIESVNASFENAFQLSFDQLVGRSLNSIFPSEKVTENTLGSDQYNSSGKHQEILSEIPMGGQTSILYDKMASLAEGKSAVLSCFCICGNGERARVNLSFSRIQDAYVISVEDLRGASEAEKQVEELNQTLNLLKTHLIPRELTGREDNWSVLCQTATVIGVQLGDGVDDYPSYLLFLESLVHRNQLFMTLALFYDQIYFVAGLLKFNELVAIAEDAISQAKEVAKVLDDRVPTGSGGKRFQVVVLTGGPFLAGFTQLETDIRKFEIVSEVVDIASALIDVAPQNSVTIADSTIQLLGEEVRNYQLIPGPMFEGQKTYILDNSS